MALGRLGKYERVDVLGHGASGIVYLAWDTLLRKQVALKEIDLHTAEVGRFLEEARVMDRLRHPNIVHVNGVDKIDGKIVIDMEYVKGDNLQTVLRRDRRLPVDQAVEIAIQTLDALEFAHQLRIVHRDIKPGNILITRSGEVKLVDFGLAEILATNVYAGGAGTYAYMAPEDFAEDHQSDHRSDIWAVGVTLFEMLTGERPFMVSRSKDPFLWRKILQNDAPGRLRDYLETPDPRLDEIQRTVDLALEKDKQRRYVSAGSFRDDLRSIMSEREPLGTLLLPLGKNEAVQQDITVSEVLTPRRQRNAAMLALTEPPAPIVERFTPPAPQLASEMVVSVPLVAPVAPSPSRSLLGLKKAPLPPVVRMDIGEVNFGEVRKGDGARTEVTLYYDGGVGKHGGRLVSAPEWVEVQIGPTRLKKQKLKLALHSERVWEIGRFSDAVALETTAGPLRIPVHVHVLEPRRRFADVAIWFMPLLLFCLLPSLAVAWCAGDEGARYLVPSAALGTGLLAGMLLLIADEANLGIGERVVCGLLMAVMAMVLGVTIGYSQRMGQIGGFPGLLLAGLPFVAAFLVHMATRKYWKFWAGGLVTLSLLASAAFTSALAR